MLKSWVVLGSLVLVVAQPVQAMDPLPEAQLKKLLSGNTAYVEHRRIGEMIRYFAADGKLSSYTPNSDKYFDGTWQVKGTELCMVLERAGDMCGTLVKTGEEYHFLKDGTKDIMTFKKFEAGNPKKL